MKNLAVILKKTSWVYFAFLPALLYLTMSSCGETKATKSDAELGEEFYVSYCQFCHGEHGDGAMASMLKVPPPDLTRISKRRNGVFPVDEIYKIIDGQEALKAGHGDREMPIWGATFSKSENIDQAMVPKKIYQLIEYLKTIQE